MRVAVSVFVGMAVLTLVTGLAQVPAPVAPLVPPPPFDDWVAALRVEAESRGISASLFDRAVAGVQPVESVLQRDRTQAEFNLDLDTYLERRLTRSTLRTAQQMHTKHGPVLARIQKEYGVPSRVLVSIWGLESNFGKFAGVRPTIPTLLTLAYDPRRSGLFREELLSALEILNRGDIELENLKGSWAGALGQPQFMPSSYLKWARDFDGDGRKDIWRSQGDVFASIAYFLQQHGWEEGDRWGREVKVPPILADAALAIPRRAAGCRARRLMTDPRPIDEWKQFGLETIVNRPLPTADLTASLVLAGKRSFLLYQNYDALLEYNCAHSYALSVALLSDQLK